MSEPKSLPELRPLLGLGAGTGAVDLAYLRGYALAPVFEHYTEDEVSAWARGRADGLVQERERVAMRGYGA